MDFHLKVVPCVGTFSARRSSYSVGKLLGRNSNWSFGSELVISSVFDDCAAGRFERVNMLSDDCESKIER